MSGALRIDTRLPAGGGATWTLAGDLVSASADALMEAWENLGPEVSGLVLDFGAVHRLDSAGISGLIRLLQAARGRDCDLTFERLPGRHAQVLELVGFARHVTLRGPGEGQGAPADPETAGAGVAAAATGDLRIAALGPLVITRAGEDRPGAGTVRRRARQLLGYLLLQVGYTASREAACAALWPGADPDAARVNLRATLHDLRRILDRPGAEGAESAIRGSNGALALRSGAVAWFDLPVFHSSLRAAGRLRDADPLSAAERYRAAVRIYRGELFADDPDFDPFAGPREEARRGLTLALRRLALAAFEEGDLDTSVAYLLRALAVDPVQEDAARWLMLLHAATGRQAEAVRAYRRLRVAMAQELQTKPGREAEMTYAEIASGRPPRLAQLAREMRERA